MKQRLFKKNFWRQRPNKKIIRYMRRKYRQKYNQQQVR